MTTCHSGRAATDCILNALKTEYIWCAPARHCHHIPSTDIKVGPDSVHPVQSARVLGVYIDGDMTMTTHINHVLSSCFSALRQIRSIKQSQPSHALDTLVTSLVHSRLDYCNVMSAGLPVGDLQRLQSVLNAAVRLVSNSSSRCSVTPLLRDRHWLPIRQRVHCKLCTLVYRCLYGEAPDRYAFKPTGSTTAALTYFMHQVTSLLEKNNYVRCLLIDFSKAFDKVDHIILVQKPACVCCKLDLFVFDGA